MTSRAGQNQHARCGSGGAPQRLGCYFCSDVVAPVDSTVDRPLDQMCTVARPGLAPIAGALAVEMMAAVLQHPAGISAPASDVTGQGFGTNTSPARGEDASVLGPVPHRIHGCLSGFSQHCLTGQAFSQCTACSACVVAQYKQHGWEFLRHALQDPKGLEDLTGLTELHRQAIEAVEQMDREHVELLDDCANSQGDNDEWTTL